MAEATAAVVQAGTAPSLSSPAAPTGSAWLERLVSQQPPRRSTLLLALLVLATAAATQLPGATALGPAALGAALAGAWCSGRGRALVAAGLAVALAAPPAVHSDSSPVALVGALGGALALWLGAEVMARCVALATSARSAALGLRAAHEKGERDAQTSYQELLSRLHYWSTHDALTGLLTRGAFVRLVDATTAAGHGVAVLVVSLAGFTTVNEEHGDRFGDAALAEVARRLRAAGRGGDVTARLDGDSLGVLLVGLSAEDAVTVGQRLLHVLDPPVVHDDVSVVLRARCGLTMADGGTCTSGHELVRAGEAAASAAVVGRPPALVNGPPSPAGSGSGLTETDLSRGIDAGELFLMYQPLVSGRTGTVVSVEALVRWRHPVHGVVPPDAFIGLAERTGLIVPLGLNVLEMACRQLAAWAPTAPTLSVAVNVSARQLVEPGFVEDVRTVLWGTRIDPALVVLELTESLLVDDSEAAAAVLWQLRGLGVRLALDDFGTGYSSLSRLGDLPLDEMKIDKSFVDRLGAVPQDSATLVTAAVAMGHGLGLDVVAEGVETLAQAAFLRDVGCDLLQGYLLGKPQPADEVTALLGRPLLPPAGAIPVPRPDADRVVVPSLLPSAEQRRQA